MKKSFLDGIKGAVIAVLIIAGASYVYAWTGPVSAPPNGNVPAPINAGSITQAKSGGIIIGANLIVSGVSTSTGYALETGLRVANGSTVLGPTGVTQMTFGPNPQSIGYNTPSINSNKFAIQVLGPALFPAAYGQDAGAEIDYPTSVIAYPGYNTPTGSSAPAGNYLRGNTYFADHGGKVGIGTINPTVKLDVTGDIKASGTICAGNGECIGTSDSVSEDISILEDIDYVNNTSRNVLVTGNAGTVISGGYILVDRDGTYPSRSQIIGEIWGGNRKWSDGWVYRVGSVAGDHMISFVVPPGYHYKVVKASDDSWVKFYNLKKVSL